VKITKQRLKQIILEEVTNRLLAESSTNLDPSQFAAFVKDKKGGFSIYLYKYDYSDTYNPVEVIGSINVQKTQMPCIPQTYEVSNISVKREYKKQKIGLDLYRFAMGRLERSGYGLTSDHSLGTKEDAAKFWKRLEKDADQKKGLAYKRQTDAGNKTFDYDKSTKDPDDDCNKIAIGPEPASDHSYIMKDSEATIARSQLAKLLMHHENVANIEIPFLSAAKGTFAQLSNREKLESYVHAIAGDIFEREYTRPPEGK
jgi:ribosomal protein S18 acetylase RimI-like enzyme